MNRQHNHKKDCRDKAKVLIPALRFTAKRLGYALGVHGSLEYDIDVIACPWRAEAVSTPEELKDAFVKVAEAVTGMGFVNPKEAEAKPHGRLAWSIHTGGGPYIDLSVMPCIKVSA